MINARPSEVSNEVFALRVRRRQVLEGNGESSFESTVSCARRGGSVPLATCIKCEHAEEHQLDGAGQRSYLLCRVKPEGFDESRSKRSMLDMHSAAERTPVAAAMTGDVVCVREDVSIEALTALFLERGISGAPVVDADGFPVGVVSKTDVVRERYENGDSVDAEYEVPDGFHPGPIARGTVGDIMTPLAFTLNEYSPLSRAAALMSCEGVHRIPVVSDDGRVVGILSSLDVMRWVAHPLLWGCE